MEHHLAWTDHLIPAQELPGSYALLSENPKTDAAILFFHGFLGDAHGTWLNFQSMIDTDGTTAPQWDRSDLFFLQYSSFRESISSIASIALEAVDHLFPIPPRSLFEMDRSIKGVPDSIMRLSLRPHKYKSLILVAHSEGAAVLRRAVEIAYKNRKQKKKVSTKLRTTELNLFAPAHLGFEPKGWIGACLSISRIEQVAITVLKLSRAFVEMKEKTALLSTVKNTDQYARDDSDYKALRARVLIGKEDDIVVRGEFAYDTVLPEEPDQDHSSICKPRVEYSKPLLFAVGK
jgi:hypothetical protein